MVHPTTSHEGGSTTLGLESGIVSGSPNRVWFGFQENNDNSKSIDMNSNDTFIELLLFPTEIPMRSKHLH